MKGFPDPGDWPSESLPTKFNFVSQFVQFHFLILSFLIYLGVVDYLTTEISTSKQKKFSLVTFVDTPGLVDGDMKYPFDVNEAIQWLGILKSTVAAYFLLHFFKTIFFFFSLGELADLIFVFFDPIGQALCKRTLNLVEQLNINHPERLRFYLSKADEAGTESDRQRFVQIS